MKMPARSVAPILFALGSAALTLHAANASAQELSFYSAVDLALRNSPEVHMAEADVRRATAGLAEARDAYLPNFDILSNIGYSYGFPVGQPTVLSGQSNSLVLSFSQPDYIRSARAAADSARLALVDTRQKVITEAALDYIELDTDQQELAALHTERELGDRLMQIEEDRVAAGLDSRVEATRVQLTNAQLDLRMLGISGRVDVVGAKLAHLDGLPPEHIRASAATIPPPPTAEVLAMPADENVGVQASYASSKSKLYVAFGDERQEYRPTLAFGLNYSRFAEFNNYQDYYNHFQHNNFGVGVNITIPLFDESKHQHARGSAAEAARAQAQSDQLRDQVSEKRLELDRNLKTLVAQQKVAELQQQLAQDQLDAVLTQIQNGSGIPGAAPLTPKDEQEARINERRYAVDAIDARFQLIQAQLNLLRVKGQIESWAMQLPKP